VPGFFGFANLGDFTYFGHVVELLSDIGPRFGLDGEVSVVRTDPTSSLLRRAAILTESVSTLLDKSGGDVAILAHSSGGLDARLMLSPGVSLPTSADVERSAQSVRALVTLGTPHYGTPLADFFNTMLGQNLLRILSLATIYTLRSGRLPISVVLRLARLLRGRGARPAGVIDQLYLQLLADFSSARRRAVEDFLNHVFKDQDLVPQIAPASMELFNASTKDRPGVRYGSAVTQARHPGLRSLARAGLDPYAQASHALFAVLYGLSSGMPRERRPRITMDHAAVLRKAYGRIPTQEANDGIVPTLSQVWGDLVAGVWADHHDVIGHFHLPTHVPPHFDWVASGSGFNRVHFEALWRDMAAYAGAARFAPRPL
jgi:triacylglycerol lipase